MPHEIMMMNCAHRMLHALVTDSTTSDTNSKTTADFYWTRGCHILKCRPLQ
jgi:hypothetical protein